MGALWTAFEVLDEDHAAAHTIHMHKSANGSKHRAF
jgi:hypothetical protein